MTRPTKSFATESGQIGFQVFENPAYVSSFLRSLTGTKPEEYLDAMDKLGSALAEFKTGRVLMDISEMKGFGLSLSATGVTNLSRLVLSKAPYFLLAIIKGNNLFENTAIQTGLKMSIPLSNKFLAGQMFDGTERGRQQAFNWLTAYPVPHNLEQ